MKLLHPQTGGLLALAAVMLIIPMVLQNGFHFEIAILIGINAIVCVGLNLLIGYTGQISLGHAAFFALGGYFSAILTDRFDWSPLGALITGAVVIGLLSFVFARPILRLKGHYLAMATLGMGIIISIVLNQETELTGGPDGMSVPDFTLLGWSPSGSMTWYIIVAVLLFITVWMALNLVNSPAGRALRAIHTSELAASTLGIDVMRTKVMIFVFSAVIASLAGSVFAHYSGFLSPAEGEFIHSIELVTMVVLGGLASVYGSLIGAAILTILPQLLAEFHDYEMIAFGAIMMGVMIFMRKGLVPTITQFFQARRK